MMLYCFACDVDLLGCAVRPAVLRSRGIPSHSLALAHPCPLSNVRARSHLNEFRLLRVATLASRFLCVATLTLRLCCSLAFWSLTRASMTSLPLLSHRALDLYGYILAAAGLAWTLAGCALLAVGN